jgi:hypothetical protein
LGTPRYEAVLLASALSFAAGLIHTIATVEHMREYALFGVFFAGLAAVQFAWGAWIFARPAPRTLLAGVYLAWGIVALWACSRTIGLPIGPTPWQPEPAGTIDVAATSDEIVMAFLAAALVQGEDAVQRALGFARRPAMVLLIMSGVSLLLGTHHG